MDESEESSNYCILKLSEVNSYVEPFMKRGKCNLLVYFTNFSDLSKIFSADNGEIWQMF